MFILATSLFLRKLIQKRVNINFNTFGYFSQLVFKVRITINKIKTTITKKYMIAIDNQMTM